MQMPERNPPRSSPFAHCAALALLAGLLLQAANVEAQVYRWRDADGRTHYADRPPARAPNEVQQLKQAPAARASAHSATPTDSAASADDADEASAAEPSANGAAAAPPLTRLQRNAQALEESRAGKAREAQAAAAAAARAEERRRHCDHLRQRLAVLESGQRVARLNAAGGREFVDDGERAAQSARLRQRIAADCDRPE